jgi:hypothetical protein
MSRTPCEYNKNLSIRVEERSRKPGHLTIKFLYQGGQTDIMAVEVAQVCVCFATKEFPIKLYMVYYAYPNVLLSHQPFHTIPYHTMVVEEPLLNYINSSFQKCT